MNGISAYQENSVATQTKGRLIVMLYDGAIKFLRQAINDIQAGKFIEKGQAIGKAQAIITELNACLDMEQGGEVAANLRGLYGFMNRHLIEANLKRDPQRIREVIACLEDLNQGWKTVTA